MIRVEGLYKRYGSVQVLRDVCFTAGEGVTCLTAPSGGGKTTLLRILLGLERPNAGSVAGLERARLSAVFQEDRLLEHRSAAGNLRFVLGRDHREPEARALLAALGLDGEDARRVSDFSGGMRRRVALARALLAPFDVLVLDEPFTGLDGENRDRAIACVRKYGRGKTVLLAAHDAAAAAGLDAQIVVLPHG